MTWSVSFLLRAVLLLLLQCLILVYLRRVFMELRPYNPNPEPMLSLETTYSGLGVAWEGVFRV